MKCAESLELSQVFADDVSAGLVKGMSEGLKHGIEQGKASRDLATVEAYDPEADSKIGSTHHARSDGIPLSVPTIAPQGLAILLVDTATQTEEEEPHPRLQRSISLPSFYNLKWK
ncbi:hypothetical protein Tco_1289933 [Tanacetum coccineum]